MKRTLSIEGVDATSSLSVKKSKVVELRCIEGAKARKSQENSEQTGKSLEVINDGIQTLLGISAIIKRDVLRTEGTNAENKIKLEALLIILEQEVYEMLDAYKNINFMIKDEDKRKA